MTEFLLEFSPDGKARTIQSGKPIVVYDRRERWRLGPSYCRAFDKSGWGGALLDTARREERLRWWLKFRLPYRLTLRSHLLRDWGSRSWNSRVARQVTEAQARLFLMVNGQLVMPETVRDLRREGVKVAVLYSDDPLPGSSNHRPEYVPAAGEADVCFVWSRRLKARLEEAGARRVAYLPFAWDPEVFPHLSDPEPTGPEVVFVGGWDPKREKYLESVANYFELQIWGPKYWGTRTRPRSPLKDCWQGRALRGQEAAEAVARADIALNILREQNLPDGTNMRTFEVPGAGGFLLATRTSGAAAIYPEDEAGSYFESEEELLENINYYLQNPAERRAIMRRAHAITRDEHRYVHRVARIWDCALGVNS